MKLSNEDIARIESWLEDESFVRWARDLDPVDMARWEEHFNLHPDHWELAKVAKGLALGVSFAEIPSDELRKHQALTRLKAGLASRSPRTATIRYARPRVWLLAASVAALLLAAATLYFQIWHSPEVVLATDYGEQVKHSLPDGSIVTLNAKSTLRYRKRKPRRVQLDGEAFFVVQKKPETGEKFHVVTEDLQLIVLGTTFNINSRNEKTRVFLEEGKVALEARDQKRSRVEMSPGSAVTYSRRTGEFSQPEETSALENSSWRDGTKFFKETPVPKALFEIEDIYGIQFVLETESLKHGVITGGVPINNLKLTLETLSEVYGIEVRSEGKRHFLRREKTPETN